MAVIAAVVLVSLIILSVVCGCKTQKVVETVIEHVHDTVTSIRTDTVREVKVQTIRDTTIQKEFHTYTLNNAGDTVREIHHYHDLWHTNVVDSTNRYEAKVDSLERALREAKNKNTVIVKRYPIPWWLIVTFAASFLALILFVIKKWKSISSFYSS